MNTGLIIMSTASKTEKMKQYAEYISDVIELQIVFGDEATDSSKVDLDTLFSKVDETGTIPQTSQPTPFAISEAIKRGFEKFDNLIIVTPHSEISGTYQNCVNVASESDKVDKIAVYQVNGGIAITEGMLIDRCLELAANGTSFEEIKAVATEFNDRMVIYTFPGDFAYLKVSGRVNGTAALLLNALNIRVVIKMEAGKPIIDNKGRGDKSVLKYIASEFNADNVEKIYYTPIKANQKFSEAVLELLSSKGFEVKLTEEANSVPAAHLGPNNFGLGVLYKKS